MKFIFLHDLGQTVSSWDRTLSCLRRRSGILCPEILGWVHGGRADFDSLYENFSRYCDALEEPLVLCGISLGGMLALRYAVEHPDRMAGLALISTPCSGGTPGLGTLLARALPGRCPGLTSAEALRLGRSLSHAVCRGQLHAIRCPALVLCGGKDAVNRRDSLFLKDQIPHARLAVLQEAGAAVNLDAPEALSAVLEPFFDACLQAEEDRRSATA